MNSVLFGKLAAAGSIFFYWHFLTLAIGITGLLLEKSARKGNPRLRSALLRLTLLMMIGVTTTCASWNSWPRLSQPMAAVSKQLPHALIPTTSTHVPSLVWEHLAVWRPVIADWEDLKGRFAIATPQGLPPLQLLCIGFLAASSLTSCFLLLRLLLAAFKGRLLRSRGKPMDLENVCRTMAAARGVSAPQVLRVGGIKSPMIMGFFRSVILLPEYLKARSEIFGHELTHLQRHDIWWHLLARLATVFMPLQPAFWYLRKSLERADEDVCDDMVLVQGADRSAYVELLLEIAECEHSTPEVGLAMAAVRSQLEHRLHRLLDTTRPVTGRPSPAYLSLCLVPLLFAGTAAATIYLDTERPLTADEKNSATAAVVAPFVNSQNTAVEPTFVIRSIEFMSYGPHTQQQKSEVLVASGLQVGMPVGYSQVRQAMDRVYALGTVANLTYRPNPVKDGISMILAVQFNPKVVHIHFEGVSADEEAKLRPLLHLKVGGMESSFLAFQDAQLITSELAAQNLHIKTDAQEDVSDEFGTAKVTFKVTKL